MWKFFWECMYFCQNIKQIIERIRVFKYSVSLHLLLFLKKWSLNFENFLSRCYLVWKPSQQIKKLAVLSNCVNYSKQKTWEKISSELQKNWQFTLNCFRTMGSIIYYNTFSEFLFYPQSNKKNCMPKSIYVVPPETKISLILIFLNLTENPNFGIL